MEGVRRGVQPRRPAPRVGGLDDDDPGWLSVKISDAETGKHLRTLRGHHFRVTAIAFHPDGRMLASASYDQTIKLWDTATGQELKHPPRP